MKQQFGWFAWHGKQHAYKGAPVGWRMRVGDWVICIWFHNLTWMHDQPEIGETR
jgi:hypothetical protein